MFFDAHLDLGYFVYWKRYLGERNVINRYYYDDFKKGGLKLVIAALYIDDLFLPDLGLKMALREYNALAEEIEENLDRYMLVKDQNGLKEVLESDKIGIIVSLEGLMPIENDLDMLKIFHKLGVRGIGLSWSRRNFAIDGIGTYSQEGRGGLTKFGEAVIDFANENNMFIDVSHANDQAVMDVLNYSKKPIIASHSNPRVFNPLERNLSDEMIEKILSGGGFIGVNGFNKNMSPTDEGLDESTVMAHIEYYLKFSSKGVGLGFDMIDKLSEIPQIEKRNKDGRRRYDVIKDHSKVLDLIKILKDDNWSDEKIEGVMWRNLYEYLMNIFK